jgi:uncharacterized protein
MRRRLRKKKHFGEFCQLGFSVDIRLRAGLCMRDFDLFINAFIDQAIEGNGLVFGGGGSPDSGWTGVIWRDHRYDSTSDHDRTAVREWLEHRSEAESFRLSEFWDVRHGSDPFDREHQTHRFSP